MQLKSIRAVNYRCLLDASLSDCSSINILLGKNNSGKSTLLRMIDWMPRPPALEGLAIPQDSRNLSRPDALFRLTVEFSLSSEDQKAFPKTRAGKPMLDSIEFIVAEPAKGAPIRLTHVIGHPVDKTKDVVTMAARTDERFYLYSLQFASDGRIISTDSGQFSGPVMPTMGPDPSRPFLLLLDFLEHSHTFSSKRSSDKFGLYQSQPRLEPTGKNLVSVLHYIHTNQENQFKRIITFVTNVLPDIGDLRLRDSPNHDHQVEVTFLTPGGYNIPLAHMGDGVEQVVLIATALNTQPSASLILLEEPEICLHPGAQRRLMKEILANLGDSQILMATHSSTWFDSVEKMSIFDVRRDEAHCTTCRRVSGLNLRESVLNIGVSPSSLLMSDVCMFVEGPHDMAVWRAWLDKCDELRGLDIGIVSLGGNVTASPDFSLEELLKISCRCLCVFDSERERPEGEPKKERLSLETRCKELGIPCFLTKWRSTENYFSVEALRGICGEKKIPQGFVLDPYIKIDEQIPGFSKKWCGRVAEQMNLDDIHGTDLWRVIEHLKEIKNNFGKG